MCRTRTFRVVLELNLKESDLWYAPRTRWFSPILDTSKETKDLEKTEKEWLGEEIGAWKLFIH